MIREVEHVELKLRRFKQAQYLKWHFFDDFDLTSRQNETKNGLTIFLALDKESSIYVLIIVEKSKPTN